MSVVSSSHFSLVRARRELEKAFQKGDWDAVRVWDQQLGEKLNEAFDDDGRDTVALIDELERILLTYSNVVSAMPVHAKGLSNHPCKPTI